MIASGGYGDNSAAIRLRFGKGGRYSRNTICQTQVSKAICIRPTQEMQFPNPTAAAAVASGSTASAFLEVDEDRKELLQLNERQPAHRLWRQSER